MNKVITYLFNGVAIFMQILTAYALLGNHQQFYAVIGWYNFIAMILLLASLSILGLIKNAELQSKK